jgi:hypothetical protein
MEARAEAHHERFLAFLDGWTSYGKGTTTCQTEMTSSSGEMKGATKMEINPEETEATVERQGLFKEKINVDNLASSEDRSGYQLFTVQRRQGAKKRIQDSVVSRQKLSAAQKQVVRRAVPAVRKGHMRKSPGKDSNARGASRGRTHVKSQWSCHKGRRHRDTKKPSYLSTIRTTDRTLRKT